MTNFFYWREAWAKLKFVWYKLCSFSSLFVNILELYVCLKAYSIGSVVRRNWRIWHKHSYATMYLGQKIIRFQCRNLRMYWNLLWSGEVNWRYPSKTTIFYFGEHQKATFWRIKPPQLSSLTENTDNVVSVNIISIASGWVMDRWIAIYLKINVFELTC